MFEEADADETLVPWSDDEEFSGSTLDPFSSILDYHKIDSTELAQIKDFPSSYAKTSAI